MQITLLKSKLHRATVTSVHPDYSGSLSIDQDLLDAAGFLHHEKILVGNITNGERFETIAYPPRADRAKLPSTVQPPTKAKPVTF